MDSAAGIGRTGPAGDEGDSRAAGHLAVGVGHVGDPAFLPADDEVDLFVSWSASRTARKLSPGTVKMRSQPWILS